MNETEQQPTETRHSNARAQAIHGSMWTMFGFGAAQLLRLGGNLILARLLFPEAFGLMALVNVFMHGLQMFSDLGIGPAIIQNPRGEEQEFRNVAWTLQIIRGVALWILSCLLAWPVAHFYSTGHPDAMQLAYILPVIGLTALLGGFTSTSYYVLNRRMRIGIVTMIELVPQFASIITMILWALFVQRSVWAMVTGGLANSMVRLVFSHLLEPGYHDRPAWNRQTAQTLIRFGRWIFASTVVSFLVTNLDRMVLGRLLSLAELGIYSIAMTFARLGMQVATRLSNVVIFPLLAKRQHKPDMLMQLCLRGRRVVLLAGGAVSLAFAILAPFFFELLYDPRYHEAGPLSRWLAIYVWTWILVGTIDRVPLAIGKTHVLFFANLLNVLGMVLAIPGYLLGRLPGFILGMAAAQVISLIFVTLFLPRQRRKALAQSLLFTLFFGLYAAATLGMLHRFDHREPWTRLLIAGIFAALPMVIAGFEMLRVIKRKSEAT